MKTSPKKFDKKCDFDELFAHVFDNHQSPERYALRAVDLTTKDAIGIYWLVWKGMMSKWTPGKAPFRQAVGSAFCRVLKLDEAVHGGFGGDGDDDLFERLQLDEVIEEASEMPLSRTASSDEIEALIEGMRRNDLPQRTARRRRAKQIKRAEQCGDLFAMAGV